MSYKISLVFIASAVLALVTAAPQARIVNGDDASEGQFPYQAQLYIAGSPTCGATVLSNNFVLTVLQCVCSYGSDNPWPPQLFTIRAGSTDLYNGGVTIRVAEIIVNHNYSELKTGLALLRLEEPLVFSSKIQPISLAQENPPTGAVVDISGFGRWKISDEYLYRTLQYYDEVMLAQDVCSGEIGKTDKTVMCLGHPRKFGICTGDFGSPGAYNGQLVGVASYILAAECGASVPDVYISVAFFREWILDVIAK